MRLKIGLGVATGAVILGLGVATALALASGTGGQTVAASHAPAPATSPVPTVVADQFVNLSLARVAALPEVKYDTVIPGLIEYADTPAPEKVTEAYTLAVDTAIYGTDQVTPVARFAAANFLGQKNVVVPVAFTDGWALVLTPARKSLPSAAPGHAPAQTAGWIRVDSLTKDHPLTQRVVVSITAQTLAITDASGATTASFAVGVGTPTTPTPTGVTGYIQARYLDPAQGQRIYPIQLTSLHSAAADEPYGGNDGGLIGVHYFFDSNGAVSHGCIRLPKNAITAVNQLPLGTLVSITN